MSVRVMSWVWEHSRSEGTDRLVLLAIADCAGDDGGNAWPSVATLADKAKVSERTVQRSVKALQLLGEITVEPNAGRRGSNVYTVNLSPRQDDTPDTVTPVNLTPGVTPVTPRGDTRVTRTVLNHPTTPQPPASGGPVTAHCKRHSKFRKGCDACLTAQRTAAKAAEARERRRSKAVFDEIAEAKANAVPRPKDSKNRRTA